jgi:hypothetical protein
MLQSVKEGLKIVQVSLNNKFKRTRLGTSYSTPFPNHDYQG